MVCATAVVCLFCGHEVSPAGEVEAPGGAVTRLPAPVKKGEVSIEETLAGRRSVRSFKGEALTREQLSQLLWSAQGVTEATRGFRAAPSAGALYPLEVYAVTPQGVFKYLPSQHAVRKVKGGDQRRALSVAALGQASVAQAPASFVITAVYARTTRKYGPRSERYVHIEAGCAAENLMLQAVAMGLASVPVGAYDDDKVAAVLGLPGEEKPLLVIPVGKPAGR